MSTFSTTILKTARASRNPDQYKVGHRRSTSKNSTMMIMMKKEVHFHTHLFSYTYFFLISQLDSPLVYSIQSHDKFVF